MSILRRLHLEKLQLKRPPNQQVASYSGVSDFLKNVKSTVDRNPDFKKTVDQLKRSSESFTDKAKSVAEDARKTAAQAFEQTAHQPRNGRKDALLQARGATGFDRSGTQQSSTSGDAGQQSASFGSGEEDTRDGQNDSGGQESTSGRTGASGKAQTGLRNRLWNAYSVVRKEVELAILPKKETQSATRARDPSIRPASGSASTGIAVVKPKDSRWQMQWADMQSKLGLHPLFQRLRHLSDNHVFNKGKEVAEDLRERWETSDSALVQRLQDMKESMMTETEPAQALREIRTRYPAFDMVNFMRLLKGDVPVIIKAYLNGDLEALKEHCSKEMMERFGGIVAAQRAEGLTTDSTILDVSDVELVDLKFVENNPVVVVQFNCQQINCSRDQFGNVVEGGPQQVQRVYYYWALQQEDAGFVGEDGNFHPPRWQLREMMVRGMHNLL